MRYRLALVLIVVCFTIALPLLPQTATRIQPQALAVIQQAYAVLGGTAALQVQDTVVQATVSAPGGRATTTTIKTRGASRLRWDASTDGEASSVIINGGRLLRRGADGQWRAGPSANAHNRRTEHLPALLVANELSRTDISLAYIGLGKVGERSVHHLRLARISALGNELDETLTKNSEMNFFVDAETFVILKISFVQLSETDWRRGLPVEIFYSDYRPAGGLLVPFSQRTVFNGRTISEMRITSFAANVGLSEADFEGR